MEARGCISELIEPSVVADVGEGEYFTDRQGFSVVTDFEEEEETKGGRG